MSKIRMGHGELEAGWAKPIARGEFLAIARNLVPKFERDLLRLEAVSNSEEIDVEIKRWQMHWNLTDEWVHAFAKTRLTDGYWHAPGYIRPRQLLQRREFSYQYNLAHEKKGDAFRRIMDAFEEHLRIELDNSVRGASKTIEKQEDHFKWLVMFQLLRMDYPDISQHLLDQDPNGSDDADVSTETIRKGVTSAAKVVGLALRSR